MDGSQTLTLTLAFFFLMQIHYSLSYTSPISFHGCFSGYIDPHTNVSELLYTQDSPVYSSLLLSSADNLRFEDAAAEAETEAETKPYMIITPYKGSHVQAAVLCCNRLGLLIRPRSGGHDYEGLSYHSRGGGGRFVLLDMRRIRSIAVDAEAATAWVGAGATIGEVYYRIAEKSRALAFPAGVCPTIGAGGHIGGGGFGALVRKHGVAADHVVDATVVDAGGRLLDRSAMGEDLFWAIRGGGAASFAVVVAWKLSLVSVPPVVTVFNLRRTADHGAVSLLHEWQLVAPRASPDLFIEAAIQPSGDGDHRTAVADFNGLYLGRCRNLVLLANASFPRLGLSHSDCREKSWIESTLDFAGYAGRPIEALLDRGLQPKARFKAKSDFVTKPIPAHAWEYIFRTLAVGPGRIIYLDPYGGRMEEIPESQIPFPHRKGNLYNIQYLVAWAEEGEEAAREPMGWIRDFHEGMGPYVSRNPRAQYLNFRDLDLGGSSSSNESYWEGRRWGRKYFKGNYRRLGLVKGRVDPHNSFRYEQSIPPLLITTSKGAHLLK